MRATSQVFWIYAAVFGYMAGIPALVLGLVAKFGARPFDPARRRMGLFWSLAAAVVAIGAVSSMLSYSLAARAGLATWLLVCTVVGPLLSGAAIFAFFSTIRFKRFFSRERPVQR